MEFSILLVIIIVGSINGEYGIRDGVVPSYLSHKFTEEISTKEIRINISLSRIEGTFLYTIDKEGNQLIASLYGEIRERMKIEYRGEEHYYTLHELCGCEKCRYKPLEFVFEFNGHSRVRCNDGQPKYFTEKKTKLLNKAYSIIPDGDDAQLMMWLVNTPVDGEVYPNNQQLSGCIHDVSLNGRPLTMETFGKGISKKCERKCKKDICNSGECYETFDGEPFCDCTNSFMNGRFCNSTGSEVQNHRIKSVEQNFRFKLIKLSWRSNSTEIFQMTDQSTNVSVSSEESRLILSIQYVKGMKQIVTCILTEKYSNFVNSTILITFNSRSIGAKFSMKNLSVESEIPVLIDLSEIYFTSMILLNGNGMIDVVYKTDLQQYNWTQIDLHLLRKQNQKRKKNYTSNGRKNLWKENGYKFEYEQIAHVTQKSIINFRVHVFETFMDLKGILIIIESIVLFVILSVLIGMIIFYKKLRKHSKAATHRQNSKSESCFLGDSLTNESQSDATESSK